MKKELMTVLFWALVLHVSLSIAFIFNLPYFQGTRLSGIYKTRLSPGPFFTDSRIVDNYSYSLSWKIDDAWSSAINPVKEDFNTYHTTLNPADLYRSRLSHSMQLTLPDSSKNDIKDRKEFLPLKQFLFDHYIPKERDSVRMWIINTRAKNFRKSKDSVIVIFSR